MINDINSLIDILNRIRDKRVLVIGDILLDEYIYGNVNHISTGIKIPIIEKESKENRLGGAANVAANIAGLSHNTALLGRYANDEAGREIKKLCNEYGIKLFEYSAEITTVKQRIYVDDQQIFRLDSNSDTDSVSLDIQDVLYEFNADVIVLADYLYGVITQDVIEQVTDYCEKNNAYLFISSRNLNRFIISEASIIVANQKEWNTYKNISKNRKEFITLGENGIRYISGSKVTERKTEKKYPINVSGAGDTVLAIIAALYDEVKNIDTLLMIANLAGEIAVTEKLTYVLSYYDIVDTLYSWWTKQDSINKILGTSFAKTVITVWKNKGQKIVFTNGCYDLLHLGHVMSFQYAKKYGDKLIVAVNSDESIKKLKGNDRPINNLKNRTSMLAYLDMIDMIIPFYEDTAIELIKMIEPDVYIKGAEYNQKKLPEAEYVKNIEFVPMIEGTSTTQLIHKIAKTAEKNNAV